MLRFGLMVVNGLQKSPPRGALRVPLFTHAHEGTGSDEAPPAIGRDPCPLVDVCVPVLVHSNLSASMGSSCDARLAG